MNITATINFENGDDIERDFEVESLDALLATIKDQYSTVTSIVFAFCA